MLTPAFKAGVIFIIYVIFGPNLLIKSIQETFFYASEGNNTINVQATVTNIEKTSGSDGVTEYSVYLTYKHNEETHSNIYWTNVSFENTYSIGDTVNVEIFASRPDDIVDAGTANYIGWIFPLFITIIGPLAVIKTFEK